jgi:hypothetical protein
LPAKCASRGHRAEAHGSGAGFGLLEVRGGGLEASAGKRDGQTP